MHNSSYYEKYWTEEGFNPRAFGLPREVLRLLESNIPQGSTCLDLGSGPGDKIAGWVEDHSIDYTGADISQAAVDQLGARGLKGVKLEDPAALPFADSSFDAAIAFEVLEHLLSPLEVLGELLRVTKRGGVLVLTVPNAAHLRLRLQLLRGVWNPNGDDLSITEPWRDPHIRFFTKNSLINLIQESGYSSVSVGGHTDDIGERSRGVLSAITGSPLYAGVRQRYPALFAGRLHATAMKPR